MDYYSEFYGEADRVIEALDWINDGDPRSLKASPIGPLPEDALLWERPANKAPHDRLVVARNEETFRAALAQVQESFGVVGQWMDFVPDPTRHPGTEDLPRSS